MPSRRNKRSGFGANRGSINVANVIYTSATVSTFPSNPYDKQIIIDGDNTYVYNASTEVWSVSGSGSGTKSSIAGTSGEINVTSNADSIFGLSNITLSLESKSDIIAGTNIVKTGTGNVIGSNVTISTNTSVSFTTASIDVASITTANIETANITESSINTATITDLKTVTLVDVATETSSGITGQVIFGTSSIFVCSGTDTWKKIDYGSW